MEPVELAGDLITIEPLRIEHATSLLAAADADEVFAVFRTDIRNERSQRAIERLGAIKEGVHRHEMQRRDGSWRDSVHYSILRAEWPEAKERLVERLAAAAA
jgi:transcriptional regulator of NAD metabolism